MDAVFIKLLNMSIAASWLILAVIMLRLLLRKAPKWITCMLWGITAVRLVCPVSFESTFSLIPSAEIINPDVVRYSPKPTIDSGVPVVNHVINPIISENFAPVPGASANPLYIWMYIMEIVWIIGLSCLLGYALIRYFRLRRSVSEAIPLRDNIWIGDMVRSPFILGIIRPKIYLSAGTEDSQMGYILAHEQAHIKRKDHWWKLLGYVLLTVYWFNPLSWAAYILLGRDIELACDEKVICGLNEDEKKLYANALVSCSIQRRTVMACPPAFGEVGVKQRVKSILHYKKPTFWAVLISISACLIAAVCFLTTPPKSYQSYQIEEISPPDDTLTSYADDETTTQKEGLPADAFPIKLLFASGASSAGTALTLYQDGSFEGQHFDHENAAGEDYPNGTCYICDFSGQFDNIRQINEYTYSMTLGEIVVKQEEGVEWIEDSILYIASKPYGLEEGKEFLFYTPGTPLEELSEDFLSWRMGWSSYESDEERPQVLPCYGLFNTETGARFFHYE